MANDVVWSGLYLGTFSQLDPDDSTGTIAENADDLVGMTFGSGIAPLAGQTVDIDTDSVDAFITTDNVFDPVGTITYDVGTGSETSTLDTIITYNATVTYIDGSTATINDLVLIQDQTQKLFVVALDSHISLDDAAIRSITFNSIHGNGWSSMTQTIYDDLDFVPCFMPGTLIRTPDGDRAVETLQTGDRVLTVDHGVQRLRMIASRSVQFGGAWDKMKPIRIRAGAFATDCPSEDLHLSPQHKIYVETAQGGRLAAAKHWVLHETAHVMDDCTGAVYYSLVFDQHELLFANDTVVESFYPGPIGVAGLSMFDQLRLKTLFPRLANGVRTGYGPLVRPDLKRREVGALDLGRVRIGRQSSGMREAPSFCADADVSVPA